MIEELSTVLEPRALPDFVETKFVKALTERALAYIAAGFPVHFRGASGTGKTTLALHVASTLERPVVMIHGDDEFTPSRPEANNVLLSVLQEKMLDLPAARETEGYLRVHPDFTAIFTSNPEEDAGVYRSQDALRDRMVTLDLDHFDEETEIAITEAKSGIEKAA